MMNDTLKKNREVILKEFPDLLLAPEKNATGFSTIFREALALYQSKGLVKEMQPRILSLFNQSIALAPNNSEELAKSYENKSGFLLYFGKSYECLVDIEKALKITKSFDRRITLEDRKSMYPYAKVKVDSIEVERELKIEFMISKEIPWALRYVTTKIDNTYGRHVVATEDIEPGTFIAIEKGYAAVPDGCFSFINCAHCMEVAWNCIPCDYCTSVIFCTEKCKQEAWSKYHDVECSALYFFKLNYIDRIENAKLFLRIFIQSIRKEGLNSVIEELQRNNDVDLSGVYDDNIFLSYKFQSICNLFDIKDNSQQEKDFIDIILKFFVKFTSILNEKVHDSNNTVIDDKIKSSLLKLLRITKKNAFKIQYSRFGFLSLEEALKGLEKSTVGSIISVFCSLFNHSCCNNVEKIFTNGGKVVLYTVMPVKKGEQLYLNYGPTPIQNKMERQLYLKDEFNFICNCVVCQEDWQIDFHDPKKCEDPQLDTRLMTEMKKANITEEAFCIVYGLANNVNYSQKTLQNVLEVMKIVFKHCSGKKAFLHSYNCKRYVDIFFQNMYGVRRDSCNIG